jgi:hypothetical protein
MANISDTDKASIQDLYTKKLIDQKTYELYFPPVVEAFDSKKAVTGLVNIKNPVLWMKDIASIFNLRKIIIYLVIIGFICGGVFGYGYWRGKIGKPVNLVISAESEFTIPVPNSVLALVKAKNSTELKWVNLETGKVIGTVKVSDIPELKKALKPYGLDIRPFLTAGGSIGATGVKGEVGIGMQWYKWFKFHVDSFITTVGIYPAGVSYRITDNFDVLAGYGFGYKGDQRIYLGGKMKF